MPYAGLYTLLLSFFLLAEGVWGMFSNVVFGLLSTNRLHAFVHLALGVIGLLIYWQRRARVYAYVVGSLLIIVGVLFLVPATSPYVVSAFAVNAPVAVLNILLGLGGVIAGSKAIHDRHEMSRT